MFPNTQARGPAIDAITVAPTAESDHRRRTASPRDILRSVLSKGRQDCPGPPVKVRPRSRLRPYFRRIVFVTAESELQLPDAAEVEALRQQYYNATIVRRIDAHDNLARFRIQPDKPLEPFEAGQYVALGLGNWEPRLQPSQDEKLSPKRVRKLARRAYSISCPMLDDEGRLVGCNDVDYLEFYITLVREAATAKGKPPALTPRLFLKGEGDRVALERRIVGKYVLTGIGPEDTVLMMGTGTGEAPHNAMAAKLLKEGHRGAVIIATTGRYLQDFAYREIHQELMTRFDNFKAFHFTTREPVNVDRDHPQYVGKQYIQELFHTGKLADLCGVPLTPDTTHVFLCGNPAMIGYQPPGAPPLKTPGMISYLEEAGFAVADDQPGVGHVRFEKYW